MPFPPPNFPKELHERTSQPLQEKFGASDPVFGQFSGAWEAIKVRYASMCEFDDRFTLSMQRFGAAPASDERYAQERDLFSFASASYSMFDAYHYGLYAIGGMLRPQYFLLRSESDEANVRFETTRKIYAKAFGNDPILDSFQNFSTNQEQKDLSKLRNVLTHRTVLARNFQLGRSDLPFAKLARLDIPIDDQFTRSRAASANKLLTVCLEAAADFVRRQL